MGFAIAIGTWLVSEILGKALRKKPPKPKKEEPKFPTTEHGRAIPVVWGTCLIDQPQLLWYGDISIIEVQSDLTDDSKYHRYYAGMHYGICHGPVYRLNEVRWDRRNIFPGPPEAGPDPIEHYFDSPALFGGTGAGEDGGVVGTMRFYFGSLDQPVNDYLVGVIGSDLPTYAGICHAVLEHMYLGNSAQIRPVSFVVQRYPNQLGLPPNRHIVSGADANPACMIYELLTDTRWGLGISSGLIDVAAFQAVGEALFAEPTGLSLKREDFDDASEIIDEICQHIDALVYTSPSTGLITMALIRNDFDVDEIPHFQHEDILSCTFGGRPHWNELVNTVKVTYVDRLHDFRKRSVQSQNLALVQAQGGATVVEPQDFPGFSTSIGAQKAAARLLKALSYPVAPVTLELNRKAWALRPGSPFRITYPPLGISGMVCRAAKVATGTLLDGAIHVDAFEDVFAVEWTAYTPPPPTGWVDPLTAPPVAPLDENFHAMPYEFVRDSYEPGQLPSGMTLVGRGSGAITLGYRIYFLRDGGSWGFFETSSLTPLAYLDEALDETEQEIDVDPAVDMEVVASASDSDWLQGRNLAIIAPEDADLGSIEAWGKTSEVVAFRDVAPIAGGKVRLSLCRRGCLDTVPGSFPAGSKVWFVSYGRGQISTDRPQSGSESLDVKLAPFNLQPFEEWEGRPTHQLIFLPPPDDFTQREDLPYPPTGVKLNGSSYPVSITGELTVSWSHRNRLGTWDYGDSGATDTPEPGTKYVLRIYGELGTLVHEELGLTGTSYTYPTALEISESGLGRLNNELRVVLFSMLGSDPAVSKNSWQTFDWTFDRV